MSVLTEFGNLRKTSDGAAPAVARVWLFGRVRFDEAALALERDGARVELERRPQELLRHLLLHAGEVVTKDELLTALWPDRIVTESSLTKCVARLRQALGDDEQNVIRTVHGYGYQFAAELRFETRQATATPVEFAFGPGDALPHRGNWRLVERLGAGGYADAWLGEHAKTHERRVFKFAHDGSQLTSLKREITLSRLLADRLGPREDFARVLDWNLEEAPFFLERDWCPAGSLKDWAEAQGGIAAVSPAVRLDLAAETAEALAAAHSVGVLHKDVKPANILIRLDEAGRPHIRLADFGSGDALDAAQLDRFGITPLGFTGALEPGSSAMGTLLYVAPEALRGAAPSVQADVYALGVVLFQLVIGDFTRAFAPGWETGIADELLRADIGLAAAGDPAERLADAAMLAQRLRSLDQRRAQLQAEALERAENEANRQALERARARRAPMLVLFATLAIGLGVSLWLYLRAEDANRRSLQLAATSDSVTSFLTKDLLSSANPLLSADPGITVRDLLPTATANLDRRFKPGTLERAAIEDAIGNAYAGLGDAEHAKPLLDSALATRIRLEGDGARDTQQVRLDLLEMDRINEDHDAMKAIGAAILVADKAAGTPDAETGLRARYAIAYVDCVNSDGQGACIDPLRALADETKRSLGQRNQLYLDIEGTLAFTLGDAHRFDEAVPMAREALSLALAIYGPTNPIVADRKKRLAQVLREAGQADEAIALCQEARRDLLAATGRETEASVDIANTMGTVYWDLKRPADALPLFQLALDYNQRTHGDDFIGTRESLNNVAHADAGLGRLDEAIALEGNVVEIEKRLGGPDHVDAIWHVDDVAGFYARKGDAKTAESLYREVIARARALPLTGQWQFGNFAFHLGSLLATEGKTDEAKALLTESVATLTATLGAADAHTKSAQAALDGIQQGR